MKNRAELYGYADGSAYRGMSTAEVFEQIAIDNRWKDTQSISGHGSTPAQTRQLVAELPAIFEQLQVKQLLDLPCGDFNWMSERRLAAP